jgi:S-DNA-T family DNA segregation ATPase FtsK/SpoIIIE
MTHPCAGTLVTTDDPVRSARLLRALGAGDRTDDLLIVDGLEAARARLVVLARGAGADLLDDTVARRRGCAVSASSVPRGALSSGPRILLGTGDRHDDVLLGVPPTLAGARAGAGRGVLIDPSGEHACQVAVARPVARSGSPTSTDRGGKLSGRSSREPLRIAPLPEHVPQARLRPVAAPLLAVGVGGDQASVITLDPSDGILVVGPSGSGRSTTLATLTHGAARCGQVRCVVSADEHLLDVARAYDLEAVDSRRLPGAQVADIIGTALERSGLTIVDGLDDVAAADPRGCEEWGSPALLATRPGRLVASTATQAALGGMRGPVAALRRSRRGVLLAAYLPGAGEVFGVDVSWLAAPSGASPGRAVVVDRLSAVDCRLAAPRPPADQLP